MHLDPILPALCGLLTVVLILAVILKRLRQPHVVAYILAGTLMGPSGFGLIEDLKPMEHVGSIGLVMLLFFVGMEVDLNGLLRRWKVPVIGTVLQIGLSVLMMWVFGATRDWSVPRIVLLGFVISLSSTAVVVQLLKDSGELNSHLGQDVIGILVVQDLALIPMLVVLGFLGAERPSAGAVSMQLVGAIGLTVLTIWVIRRGVLPVPFRRLATDADLQVLLSLMLCFGLALASGLLGLSSALGAFVAGLLVTRSEEEHIIERTLEPFRIVLVGGFFVSIGMLIDLRFLLDHWGTVLFLLIAVFITNTLVNAVTLRALGDPWGTSLYAGALLGQIGELSFVLAAVGYQTSIITEFAYNISVITIALSLTVSPLWVMLFNRLRGPTEESGDYRA